MSFEDDLRRVDEHVAEARRFVQSQKGLIVRLEAAGASTLDAREYFGSWNRTYGDWRNTETGSEQICSRKGVVMMGAKTAAYSLGHVDEDAPCLVARQQISGGSATGLVLP
jgi:hypothetical protein